MTLPLCSNCPLLECLSSRHSLAAGHLGCSWKQFFRIHGLWLLLLSRALHRVCHSRATWLLRSWSNQPSGEDCSFKLVFPTFAGFTGGTDGRGCRLFSHFRVAPRVRRSPNIISPLTSQIFLSHDVNNSLPPAHL